MNDLPHCIENRHVTMYADDTSTSCEVKSLHDITVKVMPDSKIWNHFDCNVT